MQILRIQRWFSLATAITTGLFAVGFAAWATLGSITIVGEGAAGSPVTIEGDFDSQSSVDVFVDARSTIRPYECEMGSGGALFSELDGAPFSPRVIEGTTWYWVGSTGRKVQSGDTVTCPAEGLKKVLLIDDRPAFAKMMAIIMSVGSVLFTLLSVGLFVVTRRRPQQPPG